MARRELGSSERTAAQFLSYEIFSAHPVDNLLNRRRGSRTGTAFPVSSSTANSRLRFESYIRW
jgi:hypothetical protein